MLAYFLATIVALISLVLFLNSFISPKIHRQDDFLWSGLGLFYALILWICASRFTGAILLGQVAVVALTISFMWENRQLRKIVTAESETNELLEGFSILSFVAQSIGKLSAGQKASEVKSTESVTSPETPEVIEESEAPPSEEIKESATPEEVSKTVTEEQQEEEITPTEAEGEAEESVAEKLKEEVSITSEEEEVSEKEEEESEEDLLGSSLTKEAETKVTSKPNLFSRLFGIFRKSEPQKQEIYPQEQEREDTIKKEDIPETLSEIEALDDEKLAEVEEADQDESSSKELDLKTTATEVEEAIKNLELSENLDEQSQPEVIQNNLTETTTSPEEEDTEPEIDSETAIIDETEAINTPVVEDNLEEMSEEEEEQKEEDDSTIPESNTDTEIVEKTEVSNPESGTPTTPEEDDIIESLSDLFPKPNEVDSESKSFNDNDKSDNSPDTDTDEEIDDLAKMFEDKDNSESDSNPNP